MGKHSKRRRYSSSSDSDDEVRRKIRRLSRLLEKRSAKRGSVATSTIFPEDPAEVRIMPEDMLNSEAFTIHSPGPSEQPMLDEETPPLDAGLLKILGYNQTANEEKQLLHRDVSQIWTSILKNGLEKERGEELIAKYPPFSNCPLTEPHHQN